MTSIYLALLTGFAIGLAALFPLALYLRPRYKAAGYSRGYQAGQREAAERIAALNSDLARHKHIREIEYQGFQQRTEAIMQDCDERIAVYARRALTSDDINTLSIVNKQLLVAVQTYINVLNLTEQARFAHTAAQRLGQMIDRIAGAMNHKPTEQEAA